MFGPTHGHRPGRVITGTHRRARLMRALLSGSALATVLAGLMPATVAYGACVTSGPVGNPTALDCSGASSAAAVVTGNTITVTTADDTSITAAAPISVVVGSGLGGGDIVLNNIGGSFTATTDGIVLISSGAISQASGTGIGATVKADSYALTLLPATNASVRVLAGASLTGGSSGVLASTTGNIDIAAEGGTFKGTTSDGLTLIAGGNITVNDFAGSATGGQNGLFAQSSNGTITIDRFTGTADGTGASGVFAQVTGTGDVNIRDFSGGATAGQNAIFAQANAGQIDLSGFSGTADSSAANGIFTQVVTTGDISLKTFSGSATGTQNGILAFATSGTIDASGFSGTAKGTGGSGLLLSTTSGAITADNFTPGTGSGPFLTGAAAGIQALSTSGAISIQNFGSSAQGGQYGIFAQTGAGSVNVSGFSGSATGTSDYGVYGRTTSGAITADNFTAGSAGSPNIVGGANGVMLLTDTGAISVKNFAASTSGGQYGIFAQAGTSGNITVSGFSGTATGGTGAGVFARTLGGSVTADTFSGSASGGQYGAFFNATGGDLSIQNFSGTAKSTAAGGFGLYGEATGTITFTTSGSASIEGTADGVFLKQMGGKVAVNLGDTTEVKGSSVGLRVSSDAGSTGDIVVETAAGTSVSGAVGGIRIDKTGTSGNVDVTTAGTVSSSGGAAIAAVSSVEGTTQTKIGVSGAVTGNVGGIVADATSTKGNATTLITTDATVKGGTGTAVKGLATSTTGDAVSRFTLRGAITDSASGADAAATAAGTATTEVKVENAITVSGFGVRAVSTGAGGSATVTTTADGAITSGAQGIDASATGTGMSVTVTTDGLVKAGGAGILAALTGDGGTVNVTTNAKVTAGGIGIDAGLSGAGGTVTVKNTAEIDATGSGILALNTGGATTVTVAGKITAGGSFGVGATSGGTGAVRVDVGADISSAGTGVVAQTAGTGDVTVALADGVRVLSGGTGVQTLAGGGGAATVTLGTGARIYGDSEQVGTGNGIRADGTGTVAVGIGAFSVVSGSGASEDEAVIRVSSGTGTTIDIGTGSLVSSWTYAANGDLASAAGRVAIRADAGSTTVTNNGTVVGRVSLADGNDTFNNRSSNTWVTVGANSFGGGIDQVNNVGLTVTALNGAQGETTTFTGLETFVNGSLVSTDAGLLTMIDETPGQTAYNGARDVTYVSGVFVGQGNSRLGIDAWLGGPGSTADRLVVGGLDANGNLLPAGTVATQGQTAIVINDVSGSAGGYNPKGMMVVEVVNPDAASYGKSGTQEASFVISSQSAGYDPRFGGVIDKGVFFYDLVMRGNDTYLVGVPDREAYELPRLVTGAQSIWYETSGGWLDRQADLRTYLNGGNGAIVGKAPAVGSQSVTPGVWAKAVGSWGLRDSSTTATVPGGAYTYDMGYSQDTYGFIAGADFGKTNVSASGKDAVMFGVMGGYVTSQLGFDASPTSANYSGGTVGAYATYLNRNWFVDGLFKADILSMDYTAPTLGGPAAYGQSVRATSLGFTLDTGYRAKLGATGFFEPIATLSYVSTRINSLPLLAGTAADFGSNDSLRVGLGARVGGPVYDNASLRIEANLNARLWYEFLGDNTVTIYNPGLPLTVADDFNGAFGEIGGGFNVFAKGNGWNGFTTASLKFGEGYAAANARGGVRYQW
ncbi:hypothetical protein [Xanthobacter sp. 126]|uniref:hypothetical protein n=1 Tax=Xanthobacter sp. 126 TaxID=1131814 RepID=UPI00045EB7FD|nr:hypothetical protein [Xanthobacter sp. 126]